MNSYFAHPTAVIDEPSIIGKGSSIWHFVHICAGAEIGENCSLGQNVMVGPSVKIGNNVKIQNNVSLYSGVIVEDDVFLGPSCVLTNISNPRSQISRKNLFEKTLIRRGSTVGANATIVCGITLGRYSFIAAGAVVTKDVADYAFILGVPGFQKGWMSRHGHILDFSKKSIAICAESGFKYELNNDKHVHCLDYDEEASLPENMTKGRKSYKDFKK